MKALKWIGIVIASLIILVLIFYAEEDWRGKRAWEQCKGQLEAQGEKLDWKDFIPPPVPNDQNFALTPIVASCYEGILDKNGQAIHPQNKDVVRRLDMTIYDGEPMLDWSTKCGNWAMGEKTDLRAVQLYYRGLSAKANAFPVASQPLSPAADVLLALSKYDQTIEELRRAATLPDSRFPLNYDCEPPAGILFPHLAALKKCNQVLQLRAVAELQNGQSNKALADVKLMLRLMESVHSEPGLISQLVRIDMLNLVLQPVWEGIQDHLWSDVQLRDLDEDLATLNFLADYESSVRSDRALRNATIEYLRRTRDVGAFFGDGDVIPLASEIELRFAPGSVYYHNELAFTRACQEWLLPIADIERHVVSPEAVQQASINVDNMRLHWSLNNVLPALMLPAFETCAQRYSYAQSSVDMARITCTLERYRLVHGEYPDTLDALTPDYIETIPQDIIGGQPLHYRRTTDGKFLLYSVGWNEKDDGGRPGRTNYGRMDYSDGDWVWPSVGK